MSWQEQEPNQSEFELSGEAVDAFLPPHCPRFKIPSAGSTKQPASGLAQLSLQATALIWLAFRARASGRVEQARGPSRNRRILLADAGLASLLECRDKSHNLARGRPSFRSATAFVPQQRASGRTRGHSRNTVFKSDRFDGFQIKPPEVACNR